MTAYEAVGSSSWPVFIVVTVIIFGWFGMMTAVAMVRTWRPWWSNIVYGLILGVANRVFELMLFNGTLLHLGAYIVDTVYIIVVMLISYRVALTHRMTAQYPWLYERAGLFRWREKVTG